MYIQYMQASNIHVSTYVQVNRVSTGPAGVLCYTPHVLFWRYFDIILWNVFFWSYLKHATDLLCTVFWVQKFMRPGLLNINIFLCVCSSASSPPFSLLFSASDCGSRGPGLRYTYDKSKGEVFQQHEANVACVLLVQGPLFRTVVVLIMGSYTAVCEAV